MAEEMAIHIDELGRIRQQNMDTVRQAEIREQLSTSIRQSKRKIVVLDDDPTGVQTVHDVYVYTDWSEDSIRKGFQDERNLFYLLTNSRGFTVEQTTKCHQEIISRVEQVSKDLGMDYLIMSRGDSTLRGHYPLETNLLRQGLEADGRKKADGEILCPFFPEGGRYTIENIHYVKVGEQLIPAGQTEFAKDKTFGYQASNLCEYIEEKTEGAYKAEEVTCISLKELREGCIDSIQSKLMNVHDFGKIIVNAVEYSDLEVFAAACYQAMEQGRNYMFRTAAALVKIMGGISDQPLLTRKDMIIRENNNGGIIVVGSHTQKTTMQLEELRKMDQLVFLEFNSDLVLDEDAFEEEMVHTLKLEERYLMEGKTVVVYTKRKLLTIENDTKEEALLRSVKISDAVQSLVGKLTVTPSFVIAKGGITSSDVGTKALGVKQANVMGQIRPGIPVWQTREESRFPFIPYIIFPGNVGETTTLNEAVEILLG